MAHEVISYRGSFARSPAGSARHCSSSFFLIIIVRRMSLGGMRGRRRTWWGRVKLSLICSSSQSQ